MVSFSAREARCRSLVDVQLCASEEFDPVLANMHVKKIFR